MITAISNGTQVSMTASPIRLGQKKSTQSWVQDALMYPQKGILLKKANSIIVKDKKGRSLIELQMKYGQTISKTKHTYLPGRHEYATTKKDGTIVEYIG
jgi:hypothetical protein